MIDLVLKCELCHEVFFKPEDGYPFEKKDRLIWKATATEPRACHLRWVCNRCAAVVSASAALTTTPNPKKIARVSERPIDGRTPNMSISTLTYQKGLENLREQAKREHRKLLTNEGIEDYTEKHHEQK